MATIGVLLHAGLIVRHHSIMAAADYDRFVMADVFGALCLSNQDTDGAASTQSTQAPAKQQPRCPICLGFASSAGVVPELVSHRFDHDAITSARHAIIDERAAMAHVVLWPPGRGPPSLL
ncbi:MAG: hypothetical protein HY852_02690 [Bradyrhizobium sp.]|uniref:hypothetical protein n=1 Tax=Bradyrhizobium sp. TaxID=376 RepID=UPI0025BC5510|nr:hypothetical protein [Bradyrhizobium sp.]MBI5260710.1 hypothetical protein [Bradyrhizobium sp.]